MSPRRPISPQRPTGTPAWRVVAEREIRTKVANRVFKISFLVMAVLALAGSIAMSKLMDKAPSYDIAVASTQAKTMAETGEALLGGATEFKVTEYANLRAAERAVRDGDADVALLSGADDNARWQLVGNDSVDPQLSAALGTAVSNTVIGANAERENIDLSRLSDGSTVSERLLDPNADENGPRKAIASAMALLFYLFALLFGIQIAHSVVEEKESRVVEILAAATDTRALLWGKIVGNTALAMVQIVILVALAMVGLIIGGQDEFLAGIGGSMVWFVVFFLLGFVALASLWSAAGAMASRVADVGSASMPMQGLLFVGYLLSMIGTGTAVQIGSFVPIVSAMVMPTRIAYGDAGMIDVVAALVINVVAAFGLVVLGSRIYDRGLLQTDRTMSLKEAVSIKKTVS